LENNLHQASYTLRRSEAVVVDSFNILQAGKEMHAFFQHRIPGKFAYMYVLPVIMSSNRADNVRSIRNVSERFSMGIFEILYDPPK
jgi:hypothetical protein